jgi:lipopolysaccharide/colanic/teichoic acid biosynthesis glycosyltransferase
MTFQTSETANDLSMSTAPFGLVRAERKAGLYRNFVKRAIDVTAVLASGIVVLPVIALLALIVARDRSSPFYRSARVGKGGKVFYMLKLRTMVPDADRMLEKYLSTNAQARLEWNSTQKLKSDPRITKMGRFLRKSSLDELPQLWNVLIGDMSLVGPRPMMPSQRVLYSGMAYYSLRPGITGSWQISDRNECEFSKRAEYDRSYDRQLSFRSDLRILLATVSVVLRGTGY